MSNTHQHIIHSLAEMSALGQTLGATLTGGEVCYFSGDLGAGKTTLIKGIAQGLGYADAVTSPTYNIIHEYPAPSLNLYHVDLYRIESPEEVFELGLPDLVDDNHVLLIEWPQKGEGCMPDATVLIDIQRQSLTSEIRLIKLTGMPRQ